jgi:hypothetical protein
VILGSGSGRTRIPEFESAAQKCALGRSESSAPSSPTTETDSARIPAYLKMHCTDTAGHRFMLLSAVAIGCRMQGHGCARQADGLE